MLRPPVPCPWEDSCRHCSERLDCPSWLEYLNTNDILCEQVERGNLRRSDFHPVIREKKEPNWDKIEEYSKKKPHYEWS